MIIRALRVEGFLRYEQLELRDLPQGVIGIFGDNETGKSSIGEAIAFSLFGRTVRTEDSDPAHAIRWGSERCRTSIELEMLGRGTFRVERMMARTGEFEARLLSSQGDVLAQGPQAVTQALHQLLGFDFPLFRYSFYVAQGELDLLQVEGQDNARRVVYDMLGVTTIERARVQLEHSLTELRTRVDALERDLIVASALHTEALPVKDEVTRYEEDLSSVTQGLAAARYEAEQAQLAWARSEAAVSGQRAREEALASLEGALVSESQRQRLRGAFVRLKVLNSAATKLTTSAEEAATKARAERETIDSSLETLRAVEGRAERLAVLVEHRGQQLAAEIGAGAGVDGLPARLAREAGLVAREEARAKRWLVLMVGASLLTLAGAGVSGALHLPPDAPLLTLPVSQLVSPRLQITIDQLTPLKVSVAVGVVAGLCALTALLAFLRRKSALTRAEGANEERARLEGLQAARSAEAQRCAAFALGALKDIPGSVEGIGDPKVQEALAALQEAAGKLMERGESVDELLEQARERAEQLRGAGQLAEERLGASQRAAQAATRALADLEAKRGHFMGEAELPSASGDEVPGEPGELLAAIEETAAGATRARLELEGLAARGRDVLVAEPTRALRDALTTGFGAVSGDEAERRARYDEQTGLPELLKDRAVRPSDEDLRAVLRRERELLDELLGTREGLDEQRRLAEERVRAARMALAEAQAQNDETAARGERIQTASARLEELSKRISGLKAALAPTQREVDARVEAIGMFDDLAGALKGRFGPGIARYMELVLPRVTGGRYRRVQVDDDLDIRIFSPERGDFVRLIDASRGTADQVLIALRLGLARALISSRGVRGGHFLFLDEPLVSADEAREQAFFNLLRAFDEEFAQVFVTSPRQLPEGAPVARLITLARDEPEDAPEEEEAAEASA